MCIGGGVKKVSKPNPGGKIKSAVTETIANVDPRKGSNRSNRVEKIKFFNGCIFSKIIDYKIIGFGVKLSTHFSLLHCCVESATWFPVAN
jgi:hypothetical protein